MDEKLCATFRGPLRVDWTGEETGDAEDSGDAGDRNGLPNEDPDEFEVEVLFGKSYSICTYI